MKVCTIDRLSFDRLKFGVVQKGRKSFAKIQSRVLCECNLLLKAIKTKKKLLGTCTKVSREVASNESDEIFITPGLRGMLKGKIHRPVDKLFPFVASFINQSTKIREGGTDKKGPNVLQ